MRVLIWGVAGITGRLLAESLITAPEIARVTGLDARPCIPPLPDMQFVRALPHQPEWTPLLGDIDAAIHMPGVAWPGTRRDSHRLNDTLFQDTCFFVESALAAGVHKVIVVTSAALYGPQPSGAVDESAPVRGYEASAYARARARVSDYLDVLAQRGYNSVLTRLRVAWPCGARHTALARYVRTEPVLARGRGGHMADRTLGVVHESDVMAAIQLALRSDLPGVFNVSAGDGSTLQGITFRELVALAGQDRGTMSLARIVARAWWRWRWRGQPTPPGWVRELYRASTLNTQKLRATGWEPQYSAREAVLAALNADRQ